MEAPAPNRQGRRSAGCLTFTQRHHRARRARAHASIRRSSSCAYPAYRPLAREGALALGFRRGGPRGKLILARGGGEFFKLQFQLFDPPRAVRSERWPYDSRLSFSIRNSTQHRVIRQLRLRTGSHRLGSQPGLTLGFQRCQGTDKRSDGRSSGFDIMKPLNQIKRQI